MIKLVVSDMDGTLLNKEGLISEANFEAIQKARSLGVPFVLCTGRIYSAVKPYAEHLGLKAPVIGCNGAIIKSPVTGEVLYVNEMDDSVVASIVDIFRKYDHYFHFYDEDTVYAEKRGPLFDYIEKMTVKLGGKGINTKLLPDVKAIIGNPVKVLKMGFNIIDEEVSANIIEEVKIIDGLTVVQSAPALMDIMNASVSKGKAIQKLADIYEISTDEIMAMGDNDNDIEMLQTAGVGVAMDNAKESVKAVADDVAVHHEEDGVAWALEKYVLSQYSEEATC